MKHGVIFLLAILLEAVTLHAQVSINTGNAAADPSAMLDVTSSAKGVLIPRMTAAERDAISSPANGLLVFCTDNQQFYCNQGTPSSRNWVMVNSQWKPTGSDIYFLTGNVGIGTSTPGARFHLSGNAIIDGTAAITGKLSTPSSSSSGSGFILPHGYAPSVPVNGDLWTTTAGLFAHINGTTLGPFGTGNGTVTAVTAASPLVSSGGVTPEISIPQSSWISPGYLSAYDWGVFYSKVGSVSATSPLSSSGGTSPNLTISQASGAGSGYLTSGDWSTFNAKENALSFTLPLTRATNTISLPAASGTLNGYLSSADYSRIHGTTGSVLFFDGNGIQQKNSSLFWDNTSNRLGILTANPLASFSIGSSSQFQVASGGNCSVSLSSAGAAINASNTNGSGTGIISYGQGTSSFDQSTPSGGAFKGSNFGVYGEAVYNATGGRFGGYFYTKKSDVESSYAYVGGYLNGTAKTIYGVGYTSMCVSSPSGGNVDMFGQVAPEILMNDYGAGKLHEGFCHIEIDPLFSENIISTTDHPLRVFIQPEGACRGVFVTNKSVTGFDVVEQEGGKSDISFSWAIVANRKDVLNRDGAVSSRHVGVRFPKSFIK
ncbi:MAG: hypothetical protein WCK34_05370 [Bacteroidota bacterium]